MNGIAISLLYQITTIYILRLRYYWIQDRYINYTIKCVIKQDKSSKILKHLCFRIKKICLHQYHVHKVHLYTQFMSFFSQIDICPKKLNRLCSENLAVKNNINKIISGFLSFSKHTQQFPLSTNPPPLATEKSPTQVCVFLQKSLRISLLESVQNLNFRYGIQKF